MASPSERAGSRERRRAASTPAAAGSTRLLWEADALLALVPHLRATGFVSDLARLREKLAAALRDFQARARRDGVDATRTAQASEVLAALFDHVVTSMPWGSDAGWSSLASVPSPAASPAGAAPAPAGVAPGGARSSSPAERLLALAQRSAADRGLRELVALALALGFDAAGRRAEGAQLDALRRELAAGTAADGARAPALSPRWQSGVERASPLTGWLPLWVSSALVAALLAVLFFALELSLAAKSDRLYARIGALNAPVAQPPRPLPAKEPRLAAALAEPLAGRNVAVRDEIDRSVIVLPGAQLFAVGSATLEPAGAELLRPIAAALQATPGRVQVIGHTGAEAVRSARYPSDWDLSVDRARAVREALHALGIDGARLSYDGRGSIEPAAPEPPRSGDDGRIEIVLLVGR